MLNNFRFNSKNLSLKFILVYVNAATPRRSGFFLSFVLILVLGLLSLIFVLVFALLRLIVVLILVVLLIVLHFKCPPYGI